MEKDYSCLVNPSTVAATQPLPSGDIAVYDDRFFGHPKGLSTLFFTEMWERFSCYGMRALLILFMTAAPAAGGLGFDTATAGAIYGLYTSMVYMTTLPGGWIADRLIGPQRAVLYGGILIASGHFSMAVPSLSTFYLGLLLIVIGTGLLKGNVSVIVGRLYPANDARRDAGYSIFYMGINTGAFIAPLVCGYLGQRVNWHLGFAAAGVGMVFGLVQYSLGRKYLGDAGRYPATIGSADALARQRRSALRWAVVFVGILVTAGLGMYSGSLPVTPTQIADAAGYFLLGLTVAFFGWLYLSSGWTPAERKQLYVIGVLFLAAALFWSQFEQAGSTLNLFADRNTRTSILGWSFPSSWFQSLNSLFIIALAPLFAWFWVWLARRGSEPSSPAKFGVGLVLVGAGFAVLVGGAALAEQGVMVSPMWLVVVYFLHTCGELFLSPVGLSAMSKLAPVRIGGLIMGVWFLAAAVGNYIGGRMAGFYESMTLPSLFGAVAAFGIGAGVLLLLFARPMRRWTARVS
jgi:proton-dependent oligopeptide transporter, POT family